jgi:hypothetical protein
MSWKLPTTLAAVGLIAGCATATLGDKSREAELKRFASIENAVSVYVCREDTFNGGGIGTEVFVNGQSIGSLKPNTFAHTMLAPGEFGVFLRRNGLGLHSGDSGTLKVPAKVGDVVLVWAGPAGFMGPLTVDNFSSAAEGRACVQKATYAVR